LTADPRRRAEAATTSAVTHPKPLSAGVVDDRLLPPMNDARIAEERIDRLAEFARQLARAGDDERAREAVRLARRIAERHRCGLPREFDRFTCDACDAYLLPGRNARVRLREGSHVVIRCDCGATERYPYRD